MISYILLICDAIKHNKKIYLTDTKTINSYKKF